MKNIQIIEPADNCAYDVYQASEDEFQFIFPGKGQEIEFIEHLEQRAKKLRMVRLYKQTMSNIWLRWIDKKYAHGIHGTLFYGSIDKLALYPAKKWDVSKEELEQILTKISKK